MAYRFHKSGLGDSAAVVGNILNPTKGTALNCSLFGGGVFQKACWCLSWPSLCSESDYVAAQALANPDVYNTLKPPPPVGSPTGAALNTPPASGEVAQQTVDTILTQQMTDWQTQNQAALDQTQGTLDAYAQQYQQATSGTKWWLIAALAGLGLFAFTALGGRR